ncbi:hypothetical protein ACJX0J_023634, partial [Zea mays]
MFGLDMEGDMQMAVVFLSVQTGLHSENKLLIFSDFSFFLENCMLYGLNLEMRQSEGTSLIFLAQSYYRSLFWHVLFTRQPSHFMHIQELGLNFQVHVGTNTYTDGFFFGGVMPLLNMHVLDHLDWFSNLFKFGVSKIRKRFRLDYTSKMKQNHSTTLEESLEMFLPKISIAFDHLNMFLVIIPVVSHGLNKHKKTLFFVAFLWIADHVGIEAGLTGLGQKIHFLALKQTL